MRAWVAAYLGVVALVSAGKAAGERDRPEAVPAQKGGPVMAAPTWKEIKSLEVAARPQGLWTLAVDHVDFGTRLRLVAKGEWSYSAALKAPVSADGDPASPLKRADALFPEAPIGALIGKVGGSTAGIKDDGRLFVVGRSCVLELDDKTRGPLYLTINDELASYADNDGKVAVTIERVEK